MKIFFWLTGCGHCKAMKKDYGLAALELNSSGETGVLATVDATVERNLANRYGVKGYPSLKFFRNGRAISEYDRGRTASDIVEFMKNPPSKKDEL